MANRQRRDSGREAMWRRVVARHRQSGLTVRLFCEREGVPESAFYVWRRTIRQRDAGDQRDAGGGVDRLPAASLPAFVPMVVQAADVAADRQISIALRGGRVLRLPLSMPPAQLAAVVHAIEAKPSIFEGAT